jgi:hypothetical protein
MLGKGEFEPERYSNWDLKFKEICFLEKFRFATGILEDASANISSVVIEASALAARFLVQVASLASRHGQFTVRAAFFLLFWLVLA